MRCVKDLNSVNLSTRLNFLSELTKDIFTLFKFSLRIDKGYIYPVQVTTLHQYIVFTWTPCITFEMKFLRRIEQML